MSQVAKMYITNKISFLLNNKYPNFKSFLNENNSFEKFKINHCDSNTECSHFNLTITNEEYQEIINNLELEYSETSEITNKNNKIKVKQTNNTINGFVDALILVFISCGIFGIILLNVYSKIASVL